MKSFVPKGLWHSCRQVPGASTLTAHRVWLRAAQRGCLTALGFLLEIGLPELGNMENIESDINTRKEKTCNKY